MVTFFERHKWMTPMLSLFSKRGICARTQQVSQIFIIEQILQKLMIKFSNKFKKLCFWPLFPTFGKKKIPENLALPHTTSYGFLAPCQNLEKKQ